MLRIIRSQNIKEVDRLFAARRRQESEAGTVARRIIAEVRRDGDRALIRFARKLDGTDLRREGFTVPAAEIRAARAKVPPKFLDAVRRAARNIRRTAERQLPLEWTISPQNGIRAGQVIRPLERVACYVPGGRFPLPSTVLMGVVPAQVAGVKDIVVTSPHPAPAVLAAAGEIGVRTIFRLGGAQAIAAFAYGTESVPRADKIIGPGNRYVAAAKRLVARDCGIDFVAGPTELIIVGSEGEPAWVAADLVAQAEHDPDASAVLITTSLKLALAVQKSAEKILARLALSVAKTSMAAQGAIVLVKTLSEGIELANRLAPEHLTLLDDAAARLDEVRSAGAVFLGGYSAVAAGDYAAGGNHILPTAGAARLRGGLTAADFVKTISVQRLSHRGLASLRRTIVTLAEAEGLKAHAYSVRARFENDSRA